MHECASILRPPQTDRLGLRFEPDSNPAKLSREPAAVFFRMIEVSGRFFWRFWSWRSSVTNVELDFPPPLAFAQTAAPFCPSPRPCPAGRFCRPHALAVPIAGVCLALAQANGWDVAVIRILTVLGFFFSGGFVGIAYLAGWIGIPDEPLPAPPPGGYAPNYQLDIRLPTQGRILPIYDLVI